MIPLRDNIPSSRTPWVTYGLVALNVGVYLYEVAIGPGVGDLIWEFGVIPRLYAEGGGALGERLRNLVTSLFLHDDPRDPFGWLHLAGNMLFLWIFADNVEDRLGHVRFGLLYLLSGIGAGLAHVAMHPGSALPTIGASGAVGGVLGAYLITFPHARVITLIPLFLLIVFAEIPALIFLVYWFVLQLLTGLGMAASGEEGLDVAWWAHAGGFVAGIVLMAVLGAGPRRRAAEAAKAKGASAAAAATTEDPGPAPVAGREGP